MINIFTRWILTWSKAIPFADLRQPIQLSREGSMLCPTGYDHIHERCYMLLYDDDNPSVMIWWHSDSCTVWSAPTKDVIHSDKLFNNRKIQTNHPIIERFRQIVLPLNDTNKLSNLQKIQTNHPIFERFKQIKAKSKMLGYPNTTVNINMFNEIVLLLQTKGKGGAFLSVSHSPVTDVALGNSFSWLSRHLSCHIDDQIIWTAIFSGGIKSRVELKFWRGGSSRWWARCRKGGRAKLGRLGRERCPVRTCLKCLVRVELGFILDIWSQ